MIREAAVLTGFLLLSGCASQPKCYVTLSQMGMPTAEACEMGKELRIRPITAENAAYYVPPYILGALAYEGYVGLPDYAPDDLATSGEPVFRVDDAISYERVVKDRYPTFSLSIDLLLP